MKTFLWSALVSALLALPSVVLVQNAPPASTASHDVPRRC